MLLEFWEGFKDIWEGFKDACKATLMITPRTVGHLVGTFIFGVFLTSPIFILAYILVHF